MQSTYVEYNGVQFFDVQTRRYEALPVWDDAQTDVMFTRHTIDIIGYVRPKDAHTDAGTGPRVQWTGEVDNGYRTATDVVDQFFNIEKRLNTPRKNFRMRLATDPTDTSPAGIELLEAVGPTESPDLLREDCNNGPQCHGIRITSMAGGQLLRVECTFVICLAACANFDGNRRSILSNKWTCRDTIDQNWYTTRIWQGTLRVASPLQNPHHELRSYCLAPLAPGMRRQSMDFTVSSDGLTLSYTVVDREAAFSAPPPATSWHVVTTESTHDTALGEVSVDISMQGHRESNKTEMFALCVKILEVQVIGIGGLQRRDPQIRNAALSFSDITSSDAPVSVRVSCRAQRTSLDGAQRFRVPRTLGRPIDSSVFETLLGPNGYDNNISDDPGEEGPVGLLGQIASYFQSACSGTFAIASGDNSGNGPAGRPSQNYGLPAVSARIANEGDDENLDPPEWASVDYDKAIYTSNEVQSRYETHHSRVHLPIAKASGDYEPGDPTSAIVGLGLPQTTRVVRVKSTRVSEWPLIPEPLDTYTEHADNVSGETIDREGTLLKTVVLAANPGKDADGRDTYYVDVEFHYALDKAPLATETRLVGLDARRSGDAEKMPAEVLSKINEETSIS